MLQVALAQVRLNARRFIAVSLAVMIGVGFLTATLLISPSSKATLMQSVGHSYRNADLVLADTYDEESGRPVLDHAVADTVRNTPGVDGVYAVLQSNVTFSEGTSTVAALLSNTTDHAGLLPVDVLEGSLPASDGEVAVDKDTADRYGLELGTAVTLEALFGETGGTAVLRVSALVSASNDPQAAGTPQLYSTLGTAAAFAAPGLHFTTIQLALDEGASLTGVQASLEQQLADGDRITVRTADEQTQAVVAAYTGGDDLLTGVLLAFTAIALLVCALVVSNTFSVLVTQRTRELALLRCIGADRSQIRRSVVMEGLIVGIIASLLGVATAVGLMAAIVAYLKTMPENSFATLAVSPSAVITGVTVGVLLTMLAALAPARAATAVSPLAALRPADDVRANTRRGRIRLAGGLVLAAVGALMLGLGAGLNVGTLAVPGGMLSFVGILMCATLFVPPLVKAVGALAAPLGVPGRLASVNAVRNPQRTAATSSALLIGVTLVAMVLTGGATARAALTSELADAFPVDISIAAGLPEEAEAYTAADAEAARTVEGVTEAVLVPLAGTTDIAGRIEGVYALDPTEASAVLQDQSLKLTPDTILMPMGTAAETVTVNGADADVVLDVVETGSSNFVPLISTETAAALRLSDSAGQSPQLWLAIEDGLDTVQLMDLRTELVERVGIESYLISGSAVERASIEQIIDVLLTVVTGLLAVAVVIALVGVANTLSLSVLERTRESSLLRALGLTRGQLRGMLAVESVLIAGVGGLLGCVLGALYGWLGVRAGFGSGAEVTISVPWLQLLAVMAVAIVAGLLASVLPARRAARLSPVAGLAAD